MQVMNCSRRPVRVQPLAVTPGAVTIPRLGRVPVLVAVRSLAVRLASMGTPAPTASSGRSQLTCGPETRYGRSSSLDPCCDGLRTCL
jgi:hypothetical protein